jgi:NAD(P)-dependent dehydrogenase (short-subunit alcohol dehydrogenase family)
MKPCRQAPAKGQVAFVSGGSRGIGREIALALARAGFAVGLGARDLVQLDNAVAEVRALGVAAEGVTLDVTDPDAVSAAARSVAAQLGPVAVLVNNAGVAESASLVKADLAHWERHLRVNATGPFLLIRAMLPGMLERGWGRIVNIASLAGLHGAPYVSAYTASKHALVGLTRALAAEVAGRGVTVNAVCPGYVATDMVWQGARSIAARTVRTFEQAVQAMAAMNPGGRLIEPAEVAAVAVRLVHDDTSNGATIILDGTEESS